MTARRAKQTIVVRDDIGMGPGKIASQVAHASVSFLTRQLDSDHKTHTVATTEAQNTWLNGFTKIVLVVHSEKELTDIYQRALEAGLPAHLIRDSGETVFNGVPTLTCCAIGPDWEDKINKVTAELSLMP